MNKFDKVIMDTALLWAKQSYCKRLQVGATLVKDNRILVTAYNGTIAGSVNICEDNNKTKDEVIHAEMNALLFASKNGVKTKDTILYCSHAPCINCAKHIIQAGIKEVIYKNKYKNEDGLNLLKIYIKVRNIDEET